MCDKNTILTSRWLYKEHRQDRMRLEKKEASEKIDKADKNLENNLSLTKITTEVEKAGIDNVAFESEKLWFHLKFCLLHNDDQTDGKHGMDCFS